ncbi:hypothetical protein ACFVXQ_09925 [Kitasatospora sp. NPDC058263]
MHEAAVTVVKRLLPQAGRDDRVLAADPWRPVGLAERMTGRMGWLLSNVLNPEKLALSPAEAALLVVAPFLHVACTNRAAVEMLAVEPGDLTQATCPSALRTSYEHFFNGRARLVRRAAQAARSGDVAGADGIAWWLFRQWLARKPGGHHEQVLAELLGPASGLAEDIGGAADRELVTDLFELNTLATLLRSLRTSFDATTIRPERQLAGSSEAEQHVREQLLVVLLSVAHRLAIDPVTLPEVVVDHLGITYAVDLAELHATVRTAGWDPRGRTRVLNAACHHPAVGLALRQQAAALDALFGVIDLQSGNEPQLAPLQDLPVHATADLVRAAADAQGRPAYETTDLRFRLADDRIQELLMGEQLYGDPALAIRELYQNALDACRYREARTTYLHARHAHLREWSGQIGFSQGIDAQGRAYIECQDNGIGMGERELREVFSHAGMRFADLPEFVDEQAAWRANGIEFNSNSRFGIGVLSYFMIADDISVTTCRLDPDGHPGQRLQVDIAGPGSLFYIRDLGRGYDAGTTVRLYLRNPDTAPSCTDLLRRLLWISEYAVTAEDATTRLTWQAKVLSPRAPLGGGDPYVAEAERAADVRIEATETSDVWWTSTTGGVLSDGLWIGVPLFGAVVDLSGARAPRLTVDRRRALSHDAVHVAEALHRQIPALLREDSEVFDHEWLSELVDHQPALADAVAEAAVRQRYRPWGVRGNETDITVVGCFPEDQHLVLAPGSRQSLFVSRSGVAKHIENWRALAWAAGGSFPGVTVVDPAAVPLARPSDSLLLNQESRSSQLLGDPELTKYDRRPVGEWLSAQVPLSLGHVLSAARRLGCAPAEVVARLAEFGHRLPDGAVLPETVEQEDLLLLSQDLDGIRPWLDARGAVPLWHVVAAAQRLGCGPAEVAARLEGFGYRLPKGAMLPDTIGADDVLILGKALGGRTSRSALGVDHLFSVAQRIGCGPAAVAARLAEFGLGLPEGVVLPATVEPDDLLMLSPDSGVPDRMVHTECVSPGHVLEAAREVKCSPAMVAARLAEFGLRLPDGAVMPASVEPDDLLLLSRDLDRQRPWLDPNVPVPSGHVLAVAQRMGHSPAAVLARLSAFGYRLSEGAVMPKTVELDDLLFLSQSLDWQSPWLDPADPVSAGHVLEAAQRAGRGPLAVADRLAGLGHGLTEGAVVPGSVEPDDLLFMSRDLDRQGPWLAHDVPVPLGHVLSAAQRAGCVPAVVVDRMVEFGYRLPEGVVVPDSVEPGDIRLVSRPNGLDGSWLGFDEPVGLAHLLQNTGAGASLVDAALRLRALGFRLAEGVTYTPADT